MKGGHIRTSGVGKGRYLLQQSGPVMSSFSFRFLPKRSRLRQVRDTARYRRADRQSSQQASAAKIAGFNASPFAAEQSEAYASIHSSTSSPSRSSGTGPDSSTVSWNPLMSKSAPIDFLACSRRRTISRWPSL